MGYKSRWSYPLRHNDLKAVCDLRIIYLHQYFNTPQDPGSTRSYLLGRRLVEKGHSVHVVTSDRALEKGTGGWTHRSVDGIDVYSIRIPYSNNMSFRKRIKAFLKFALMSSIQAARLDGDVVFASSTPLTICLPGVFASLVRRRPMVFEVRDLWPEVPVALGALKNPILVKVARQLERFAYRNAERVVALSPGIREGVSNTGYPTEKISVISNLADIYTFDVSPQLGEDFRRRYDWLGKNPLVLYGGTLGRVNGVAYLVHLAAAAFELDPAVRFLVVGSGFEEEAVKELARKLSVLGRNFFMLGEVPKSGMPEILSAADLAISLVIDVPQLWNNSANKFFDALASGTPIAINYRGWQARLLAESGAGIVLPASDPTIAARQIVDLISDRGRLMQVSKAALKLAHSQFHADTLGDKLEAVLCEAIEHS